MAWFGQLNHTFTNPHYRCRGFATIVERKVCQEAIQKYCQFFSLFGKKKFQTQYHSFQIRQQR